MLELCPPGTLDPSPFLYNSTLYTMVPPPSSTPSQAGLVSCAALLHTLVTPVNTKYFDISDKIEAEEGKKKNL